MSVFPVKSETTAPTKAKRSPWWQSKWMVLPLIVLCIIAVFLLQDPRQTSQIRFAANNPEPNGAMAAAEILKDQGVTIKSAYTSGGAAELAGNDATIVVFDSALLSPGGRMLLATSGADLVFMEPSPDVLAQYGGTLGWTSGDENKLLGARCADSHAQAAGQILGRSRSLDPGTTNFHGCFPSGRGFAMLTGTHNGAKVTFLADGEAATNQALTKDGNAALILRLLGQHRTLVWLVTDYQAENPRDAKIPLSAPPWLMTLGMLALAAAIFGAIWRGRRFGPLISEPLPVLVKSAETTIGRGRLYQRSRDYAHTAQALRASTAARLAGRYGIARSSSRAALLSTLSDRLAIPTVELESLLYGPPPQSDSELLQLVAQLDHLEEQL